MKCREAIILFTLGLFVLTSCGRPSLPKTEDIVGRYEPSPATAQLLLRMGYRTNELSLTLNPDLSFAMINFPDIWLDFSRSKFFGRHLENPGYYSGQGQWDVSNDTGGFFCYINVKFDKREHFSAVTAKTENDIVSVNLIEFRNRKRPYTLHFVVGDPDSGEGLELTKTPEKIGN